jgi:hypothetical protein
MVSSSIAGRGNRAGRLSPSAIENGNYRPFGATADPLFRRAGSSGRGAIKGFVMLFQTLHGSVTKARQGVSCEVAASASTVHDASSAWTLEKRPSGSSASPKRDAREAEVAGRAERASDQLVKADRLFPFTLGDPPTDWVPTQSQTASDKRGEIARAAHRDHSLAGG